jgi:hypothetical protein
MKTQLELFVSLIPQGIQADVHVLADISGCPHAVIGSQASEYICKDRFWGARN